MFNKELLSADERKFISTYCVSVQRNYDMLTIARALMHPDQLAVKCPVVASRLAKQLNDLQQEQCAKLEALRPTKRKKWADFPTHEDIAEIFTISFFKLVNGTTKKVFVTDKNLPTHDGWSSGHPAEWQQTIKSLQELHTIGQPLANTPISLFLSALLKLFAAPTKNNKLSDWGKSYDAKFEFVDDWDEDEDEDNDDPMSFFM